MDSPLFDKTSFEPDKLVNRMTSLLQMRLGCQVRDFSITIDEKGLILRGHAGSYYVKQLAQQVAREVSGLVIAANRIEVFDGDLYASAANAILVHD